MSKRIATLYVTGPHLNALRAHAEVLGLGCAEDAAELVLSEWLKNNTALQDYIERRRKAIADVDKQWRAANHITEPT